MKTYLIERVSDIGKYACFHLSDGNSVYGKYGYFSSAIDACELHFGVRPDFPIKVKLDRLGFEYFHVDGIFYNGLWVKCKY